MKPYLIIVFLTANITALLAQKDIQIPNNEVTKSFYAGLDEKIENFNLIDLRSNKDSISIRIWYKNQIVSIFSNDTVGINYKCFISLNELNIKSKDFSKSLSKEVFEYIISKGIIYLPDEQFRGIDGSFVFFEISTPDKYRIYSYWSPHSVRNDNSKNVADILDFISEKLETRKLFSDYLEALPAGEYFLNMSTIHVDRFLSPKIEKTDFYKEAEEEISKKLNITDKTSHLNYPLIIIDTIQAKIADLNKYKLKDVEKLNVLKPNSKFIAIYGIHSRNGVVIVKIK